MNMCANHPEVLAVAYCRACGKPLCDQCRVESFGAVFCGEHAPAAQTINAPAPPAFAPPVPPNSPYSTPAVENSPALAALLGTIPGVGAIYNGQYAKGLIHAVIFGLLITVISNGNEGLAPLVGILIGVFWFYMVLEAYHTARKRREGRPVDEFSSIIELRGGRAGFPVVAVVLIGLGVLLLLDTSGLVPIERLVRYWPIALILAGAYMLYARTERRNSFNSHSGEFSDERR